jgi:uncharacterized membrane protein
MNKKKQVPISGIFFWLTGIILILHLFFTIFSFTLLPDIIPVHFNGDGSATMALKNRTSWFSIWWVSSATGISLSLIAKSIFFIPVKFINVPRKKEFIKLPADAQRTILNTIFSFTMILTITGLITLFAVHFAIFLVSIQKLDRFPSVILAFFSAILFVELFLMIISTGRKTDDLIENHKHL